MRPFPAALPGNQKGGGTRFHRDSQQRRNRGCQAIENNDSAGFGSAKNNTAEHGKLGAAERREQIQCVTSGSGCAHAPPLKRNGNDLPLAAERCSVSSSAQPDHVR